MEAAKKPNPGPGPRHKEPIEHVVIIVKENHGLDNYFGTFPGAEGMTMPLSLNPPTTDPDHRHKAWLTRATTAVRAQFVEQDIPAYFAYARQFTLCDHYFTDVAGPSTPNHLMLITWDDWGGWFDHVEPQEVEKWKDGTQFRYGSRVGCLVLSPYARHGYISKVLHSHVSLVKFCETTFGLPPLNARDAAADDMSDCFDYQQSPLAPPA